MISVIDNISHCRRLWKAMVPAVSVFDEWDVRECFHSHYRHRPHFIVAGDPDSPRGLLALSKIEDQGYLGCFPGETCFGKTWLEQNRIIADCDETAHALINACKDESLHFRYLIEPYTDFTGRESAVDEIGYIMRPGDYAYSFDEYMKSFSGKSRKKLQREIAELTDCGIYVCEGDFDDVEKIFELNLLAFGEHSYFADQRFLASFRDLARLLRDTGRLRVVKVMHGSIAVAVDMGCVHNGVYTVLAGGASCEFPGVAKMINFNHLQWACGRKLQEVDFLCGDFGWKQRFHLTPRHLYHLHGNNDTCVSVGTVEEALANVF